MKKKGFGVSLRALRLGFRDMPKVGAYVRISAHGPPWEVDVCPYDCLPKATRGEFVVWWEGESADYFESVVSKHVHEPPDKQVTISLDDDGELME